MVARGQWRRGSLDAAIQQAKTGECGTEAADRGTEAGYAFAKKIDLVQRSGCKSVCAAAWGIERKNLDRARRMPVKDTALKRQIEAVHRVHPAYGHRRVALALGINHKRAQRVMPQFGLKPPRRRLKTYSTRATLHHRYTNHLKTLEAVTQPHQVWCSDLTRLVYHRASSHALSLRPGQ
ncbi:transposase [bacterium]|nr:transposase [bacterium]